MARCVQVTAMKVLPIARFKTPRRSVLVLLCGCSTPTPDNDLRHM